MNSSQEIDEDLDDMIVPQRKRISTTRCSRRTAILMVMMKRAAAAEDAHRTTVSHRFSRAVTKCARRQLATCREGGREGGGEIV